MDKQQAAEALKKVEAHQDRTRKAARVPWWYYAAAFVLIAGGVASTDFVSLTAAKFMAGFIIVAFVVVLVAAFFSKTSLLSRVRGVQPRQTFNPRMFAGVVIIGITLIRLVENYGDDVSTKLADAIGLRHYPGTVAGVLYGAVFTALIALSQLATGAARRRSDQ